jgi:hypothetical protein
MAARTNSSWAPLGPRSRSRPSLRMRSRCANRIKTFLRSRRDCSKPSEPANDRATSLALSWMSRGILREGSFGQHCGLSGHTSQSRMRCKLAAKPGQIERRIDCAHQMIFRNRVAELKLVEKLTLFALLPPLDGLPSPRIGSARRNHGSPHASTDFCNKIGHEQRWRPFDHLVGQRK